MDLPILTWTRRSSHLHAEESVALACSIHATRSNIGGGVFSPRLAVLMLLRLCWPPARVASQCHFLHACDQVWFWGLASETRDSFIRESIWQIGCERLWEPRQIGLTRHYLLKQDLHKGGVWITERQRRRLPGLGASAQILLPGKIAPMLSQPVYRIKCEHLGLCTRCMRWFTWVINCFLLRIKMPFL